MKINLKEQFIINPKDNRYKGFKVWYDNKGYPNIWLDGKNIRLHVYIWECVNGSKPKGHDIHHIDFNNKNYLLTNLELLSRSDHYKIHAGWIKENGEWVKKPCNKCGRILPLNMFYPRKGYTPCALCKKCHNEEITRRNNKPERKIKVKAYKHEWYMNNKKKKEAMGAQC